MKNGLKSTSALAGIMAAFWAVEAAAQTSSLALEEIVVTAERREESLQSVPLAVSAFDANEIERRQTFNVVDVVNQVPNLVGSNNIGQPTATTVFLRGVGTTESIVTVDPGLGFYIDDVYVARQGVNNFSLLDVERVEVLRGPQGTLYGRNTNAGAVKVVTAQPGPDFAATGEYSYGRFDRQNFKGSVNAPISDNFYVRGTAFAQIGNGYTRNLETGQDVNDREVYGGRIQAKTFGEDWEIIVRGDYSRSEAAALYGVDVLGFTRPVPDTLFEVNSRIDTVNVGETWGVSATISYDINDTTEIESITSFRNTFQSWNLDLTDQPVSIFNLYTVNDSDQFSQELRVSGTGFNDRLDYTAGFFYFQERSFSFIGDEINLFIAPTIRVPLPFFGREYDVDVDSYAAFAEFTYDITDNFRFIGGGRFTRDEKQLDITQYVGGTPGLVNDSNVIGWTIDDVIAAGTPNELNFDEFTPRAGLQYDISEDVNVFAMYTRGFKSGGWGARTNDPTEVVDFEPETVDNYEIGMKSTVWDGRARINLTGFYYDYKSLFNTGTGDSGNFLITNNDAEVYGIEGDFTARLSEEVDIYGSFGWQKGSYKNVDPDAGFLGTELQRLPEFNFVLGQTSTIPIDDQWDFRVNAQFTWQKDHFTNIQNSELARSGDVGLLDASVGFVSDTWEFSLSCRNCADNEYIVQSLDFAGLGFVTVYPGEPFTWLATVKARY